jgi:hypothetical protein
MTETTTSLEGQNELQEQVYEVQRKFIRELVVYSRRMSLIFRLLAGALILFLFFSGSPGISLGALMGALIVEINISIFNYVVKKSDPAKKESPILVTIFKFYLLFAFTAVYVFLCIFFRLGEPIGFLFGVLTFLPALMATFAWALVSYLVRRKRQPKDELPA